MNSSNDIDLKDIVQFMIGKKYLILVFALCVAAGTWLLGVNTKSYYTQDFTIYSTLLNAKEIGPFLSSFEEIANTPLNYSEEEDKHLSKEASEALSSIRFGSMNYDQGFFSCNVKLTTLNPSYTQEIVKGLLQYINESPYLQKRYKLKQEELEYLIQESEAEIEELKKFKRTYLSQENITESVVSYPINLNTEMLSLQEGFARYKQQLELLELVQVLDLPAMPREPSGPDTGKNTIVAFLASLLFGVFLSFAYRLFF